MEEWKEYKLGEISTMKYGKLPPKSAGGRFPVWSGYRYVGTSDVMNCPKGTMVVVARGVGGTGDVKIAKEDCYLTNLSIAVNIDTTICNPYYLYYKYLLKNLKYLDSGSAQSQITIDDLKRLQIELPSLDYQNRIVAVLKTLDDKIEVNRRINDILEQEAQALFKSWFVDFEPFKNGEFVESELGRIPKGWRVGTFGEIMTIASGKRPPKKESSFSHECNIPLVGASDIMGYTNSVLFNEDILVTGRVGTHGIVQRFNYPCWPSDNTLVLKSDYYEFCYQILCTIDYASLNRGSTQPLITQTDIKNQIILIPPNSVLSDFEKYASTLMKVKENNQRSSRRLAELRDTLLPKLMSGELIVNEIDDIL